MKIKLAILENEQSYLNRIVSAFSVKYADRFQIFSFTDPKMALVSVDSEKIDVLISNDAFDIDTKVLPKRCSFAYFVDSSDVETVKGQRAICKYQRAELIYKEILSIYSENAGSLAGLKLSDDECQVICFSSPCGGTGTTTLAAACALHFASMNKKTLYLSFNDYASTELYFDGDGTASMSDVIFTIKSKKANLQLKLESCVRQDASGVFYFASAKYALDMLEFKYEERIQLLSELKPSYDYIILDLDFALDKDHFAIYKKTHEIVMVSDGSNHANTKISRAYSALVTMDQNSDVPIANRFLTAYNRFSSKNGKMLENSELRSIGGLPVYSQATPHQIVEQIATNEMFDKLN